MAKKDLCELFDLDFPLVQAGMVWVSGAKLAAAACRSGILGLIGAGSMTPELFKEHILKAKELIGDNPSGSLGVNIPLLYSRIEEQVETALSCGIKIFFTSAGSPKKWTQKIKDHGGLVAHVTSTRDQALKCQDAGVDAIVIEGFEAGGHNGVDELTTMTLLTEVPHTLDIPVIAAGGFATGRSILAAQAMGAQGVQMGTRFVMTQESSAHKSYKDLLVQSKSSDTRLMMKSLTPARLLKNPFFEKMRKLEEECASKEEMRALLGKQRAKKGMHEGDLHEGELEIGQICGHLKDLPSVEQVVQDIKAEYHRALKELTPWGSP